MTAISFNVIMGSKGFVPDHMFSEICMEVTDGHELIGECPYDLNSGHLERSVYKNINIPVIMKPVRVDTNLGIFHFDVAPQYYSGRDRFSIGIFHKIIFQLLRPVVVKAFHDVLQKITDLFSLLSGEIVTINKLKLIERSDSEIDFYEFIGYCNFPKKSLNIFNNGGKDSAAFKRISLFKITDFIDIKGAMNYWFDHYDDLYNAQQVYLRIIFDEELKAVSINKFLAAVQMIEGYAQAFIDEEKEISEFNIRKEMVIMKLKEEADREFVRDGLAFPGVKIMKATRNFFKEVIAVICQKSISNNSFQGKYEDFVLAIVNDRNFYTHSSNRIKAKLSIKDAMNVAVLCKEIYRILVLSKMGMPVSAVCCRLVHNRIAKELFNSMLKIEVVHDTDIPEFDNAMLGFDDNK